MSNHTIKSEFAGGELEINFLQIGSRNINSKAWQQYAANEIAAIVSQLEDLQIRLAKESCDYCQTCGLHEQDCECEACERCGSAPHDCPCEKDISTAYERQMGREIAETEYKLKNQTL